MADIKRFSGYTAIDGKPFDTLKGATDYSREIKVKAALKAAFNDETINTGDIGVSDTDGGGAVLLPAELAEWLYANRVALQAAFNQDVLMRKPRVARTPKAPPRVLVAAATRVSGMSEHPGVLDLDE